jgi:hypothetical protein
MHFDRAKRFTLALLALAALALVGCGGRRTVVVQANANAEFLVVNESAYTICYVNFSPTTDSMWGPDRLGAQEVIAPGQSRGWAVPADTYDFRLLDCNQQVLMERRGEPIGSGQRRTVTFRVPE